MRKVSWFAFLILAVLMGACTPRVEGLGPAVRAPTITTDAFIMADGYRLPYRKTLPDGGDPSAVILALHGFNDYSNAFADAAVGWADAGIATYAYDQRGFGGTEGRGLWHGDDAMVADAKTVASLLRRRYPHTPLILVGVSMGGAVALAAIADEAPIDVDRTALVAPATWGWSTLGPFKKAGLWLSAHSVPWLEVTGRNLKRKPSDNIAMLRALGRDPLVIRRTRIDTIYGLVTLMERAYQSVPRIDTPSLILYGRKEDILADHAVDRTVKRLPPDGPWRLARYENGFHMLLRDLQGHVVIDDIAAFAHDRMAALPSNAETQDGKSLSRGK